MKISLNWLNDYVDFNLPPERLAHKLTMAGLEVEKIESVGGDTVMELEITPNRPDCLNMIGIARELSAILNKKLKLPLIKKFPACSQKTDVTILDKEGCRRYIGIVIEGVEIKPTPTEMSAKLTALGNRAINNIVDITNFCLLELGQPMHAFDFDKLVGGKIIVRRAKEGEKIVTIDGVERALTPSVLVIADAKRPVAIAGIMGGLETEVTASTKNILLESAYFDPVLIRRTSRALGLTSDSSYRFERGVDLEMVEGGAKRAVGLIMEMADGKVVAAVDVFSGKKKEKHAVVSAKVSQINSFLGSNFSVASCKKVLQQLGFKVLPSGKDGLKITPPSFRNDIKSEVDVIEEIGRIAGYDNLPASLLPVQMVNVPAEGTFEKKRRLREIFVGLGLQETVTYSLINAEHLTACGLDNIEKVAILNPLSRDQEIMRPSILPSLLAVALGNMNRGQKDLAFFELGKIYAASGEKDTLAILLAGTRPRDWRKTDKPKWDLYDLMGALTTMLAAFKLTVEFAPAEEAFFVKGQQANILFNGKKVGSAGCLNSAILKAWDIKQPNCLFAQMDLGPVLSTPLSAMKYQSPSEYPAVSRDISLAAAKETTFAEIAALVEKEGQPLLQDIVFLEEYAGEKIPAGQKALVFSLSYQAFDRTLTEDEVNALHSRICQALTSRLGATLR